MKYKTLDTVNQEGGFAFPLPEGAIPHGGMTLRDWFAGQAISAYLTMDIEQDPPVKLSDIAFDAYRLADEMLAIREKT